MSPHSEHRKGIIEQRYIWKGPHKYMKQSSTILITLQLKSFQNRLQKVFLISAYFRSFQNRLPLWFLIPTYSCSLAPAILLSSPPHHFFLKLLLVHLSIKVALLPSLMGLKVPWSEFGTVTLGSQFSCPGIKSKLTLQFVV